ncbi:hypothetical protein ACJMK2_008688, partial [Sinanodonta woodiana]
VTSDAVQSKVTSHVDLMTECAHNIIAAFKLRNGNVANCPVIGTKQLQNKGR